MKCLCCGEVFRPDRRNRHHRKFCAEPACRLASERTNQQGWLVRPGNINPFRGAENVQRVQAWREAHPGYWRRSPRKAESTLKDL